MLGRVRFAAADAHPRVGEGQLAPLALGTDADVVQGAGRAADEAADGQFVVEHGASYFVAAAASCSFTQSRSQRGTSVVTGAAESLPSRS